MPELRAMTRADIFVLIADLKISEAAKVMCGRRIIAFYEAL
jgi:hypothetical protein